MARKKHIIIPYINSIYLLPDIKDLHVLEDISEKGTMDLRKRYAMIALLLFYSFHDTADLHIHDSYWYKYRTVISNYDYHGRV